MLFRSGGIVRGLLVGITVTILSLFFTDLHVHHLFIIMYSVLMTSALFSLGGFINAVFAKSFDDISIVPTFVLTPLTYLGGVFYSIDNLSPFFQSISYLNPIVYMVNAFRFGILGVSDVPIGFSLAMITVVTIGLYFYALKLLESGKGMKE